MLDLAYLGTLFFSLVIALVSIPISAIYAVVSRRLIAWMPVVLVLAMAIASRQSLANIALAVLIICAWLVFSWPRLGQSDITRRGKKRWHPLRALVASLGTFLVVALALGLVFLQMMPPSR